MSSEKLTLQLKQINVMDRSSCKSEWQRRFKQLPDKHLSTRLMRRALAHEVQVKAEGGLTARDRRVLGLSGQQQDTAAHPVTAATAGTHLVREWNGRTYQVLVTDDGFELDGRSYRSLSAIARHITGAHWSGPRFFGIQ